jgi:hypothetical protein
VHPCCQSRPPWRRCTSRKLQPASLDSCQSSAPKKGAEPIRDQVKRAGCTWAKGWIDIMAIVAISSPPLAAGICSVHVCFLLPSELTYVASTFTSSINPAAGSDESAQWHTWPARPEARSISSRVHGLVGYGSPLRLVRGRG